MLLVFLVLPLQRSLEEAWSVECGGQEMKEAKSVCVAAVG